MRKTILFLLSLVFLSLSACCNTLKGAAKGAAEGLGKDASAVWQKSKKADAWLQDNAW